MKSLKSFIIFISYACLAKPAQSGISSPGALFLDAGIVLYFTIPQHVLEDIPKNKKWTYVPPSFRHHFKNRFSPLPHCRFRPDGPLRSFQATEHLFTRNRSTAQKRLEDLLVDERRQGKHKHMHNIKGASTCATSDVLASFNLP